MTRTFSVDIAPSEIGISVLENTGVIGKYVAVGVKDGVGVNVDVIVDTTFLESFGDWTQELIKIIKLKMVTR